MRRISHFLGFAALAAGAAAYGQDCSLGQRYLDLAKDRASAFAHDEAIAFAQESVEACPRYDAYQMLGELAADSLDREERRRAVEAFVEAYELATADQDRAHTLHAYALVLRRDGDPQNAYPLIKQAQTLDPRNAEIAALAEQLELQIRNPTEEEIRRGLRDSLFVPLRRATGRAQASRTNGAGPSINIPMNFEVGSTLLDDETRPNLSKLGNALSDPELADRSFIFVGHADVRGDEQTNLTLSTRRAEAIYQAIVSIAPELRGRIEIEGRGESEPLDPGNDEASHRANRRLQVLLK